jgi:hypothetical protein
VEAANFPDRINDLVSKEGALSPSARLGPLNQAYGECFANLKVQILISYKDQTPVGHTRLPESMRCQMNMVVLNQPVRGGQWPSFGLLSVSITRVL